MSAGITLPDLPAAAPLQEVVLFGFDDRAFPFQNNVRPHLIPCGDPQLVLSHGPAGSHDEALLYYGTTVRIGDTFHMWYNGNHGPQLSHVGYERANCVICYATSSDGVSWEKPELGLVEFAGSTANNIVNFPAEDLWSTCALLHEPDDPDPTRRYKMVYEVKGGTPPDEHGRLERVAFSSDGLNWTASAHNPVLPFIEMQGITKHRGLYYVNGQANGHQPTLARRLVTFASADFEHWSPAAALGMDRAPRVTGPTTADHAHQYEEVHLGAALWNRGNVILGIYGQWHGHATGDRRLASVDLGLALSHDAIHFHEPLPGFRLIPAREQPGSPTGVHPALMQGQGMENYGDRTLYWYSLWRGVDGSGVRLATWERDRLGMLQPFRPDDARAFSTPFEVRGGARVFVNASGLGEHGTLSVGLVDEGFRPIPGYSGAEAAVVGADGLRTSIRWSGGDRLPTDRGRARLDIAFNGVRAEDVRLHAVYLETDDE